MWLQGRQEMAACTHFLHQGTCVLAVSDTCLDSNIGSKEMKSVTSAFRTDLNPEVTRKAREGGVCLLIRNKWCWIVVVREHKCTSDTELLCVSVWPFCLPRESPQIFITVAYIHPKTKSAGQLKSYRTCHKKLSLSPLHLSFSSVTS